jgi:GNAT superfamily N-acetyltransferase
VPGLDGWVMRHDGNAIAHTWSFLSGWDCGTCAVGTQPARRRRGFARAFTEHILPSAGRGGARTASLQSNANRPTAVLLTRLSSRRGL